LRGAETGYTAVARMGKKVNKALHPTDMQRKADRQKEIKRNKFQKAQVWTGEPLRAQALAGGCAVRQQPAGYKSCAACMRARAPAGICCAAALSARRMMLVRQHAH
jgi:hypothetical protein